MKFLVALALSFAFTSATAQTVTPTPAPVPSPALGDIAVYSCTLKYWITNGSILGGGGAVNINGSDTFPLYYPSYSVHMYDAVQRHFYAGLYLYDNLVHLEMKVFRQGMPSMTGLITVAETQFDHFQDTLHISAFANQRENIELYTLDCLKQ